MSRALRITSLSLGGALVAGTIAYSAAGVTAQPVTQHHVAMSFNAKPKMLYDAITALPGMHYETYYTSAPWMSYGAKPQMYYDAAPQMVYDAITALPGMYHGAKPQMFLDSKPQMFLDSNPLMFLDSNPLMFLDSNPLMFHGTKSGVTLVMYYKGKPQNLLGD